MNTPPVHVTRSGRDGPRPRNSVDREGASPVARWATSERLLAQFLLAKEQIDHVEGRVRDDGD